MTVAPLRADDIYVAAGASLQDAIDRAQPGDRLLLAPGVTYTGNFRLTDKGASTTYITIRSAAADTLLPPEGTRILPSDAGNLPVIKSPNTQPALRATAGAHHWRLQLLEFQANDRGYGDIITLGAGDTTQTALSQVPHHLVLDRLFIHGDPVVGQKRGVSLHSGATWVLNCYISDMKGIGMDTQALSGYNGPGPYTILNNYLEAAGENFMLGGASPRIPNLIPSDIEFAGNHLYKPLAWRTPILAAPTGVTAAASGSGVLPAGTYSYRVVAARRTAQDAWAFSDRSAERVVVVAAGGRVSLTWAPVANATTYRVYRGAAPGAQDRYFVTTSATFEDTGSAAGVADSGTRVNGTVWTVKNLFELKLGERVRVRGNLMENCWKESQVGYAVVFTPRNQDGTSPWIYVRDVEFTGNLVRRAGSGISIEGYDSNHASQQTQRITVANNIFDDINSASWGGSGRWIQIGNGPSDITIDHNTVVHDGHAIYAYGGSHGAEMQVPDLRFTNNLLRHNAYGIMGNSRSYGSDTLEAFFPGAVLQRNTLAGGVASRYPPGNEFPSVPFWQAQFADIAASNLRLIDASPYRASGTDGLDLGAPVAQVEADALVARNGRSGPPPPLAITTMTLPDGRTGAAYAATLAATGGSGTCTWSVTSGALPPGVSLAPATGVLSGTPTLAGTFMLTLRAQDATDPANAASQGYTLPIASMPPTVSLVSPASAATVVDTGVLLEASAADADGTVTRVDFYANAVILGSASSAPWSLAWADVAPGAYRVTVVATDDSGLTATSAAVDLTVIAPESLPVSVPVPLPPLTVTAVTASPTRAVVEQPVTLTATATGGATPYTYQFWVYDGAGWRLGRDWSPSATWVWTPAVAGSYSFQVWARHAGSSNRLDAFRSFGPYTVRKPSVLAVTALTADRVAPTPAGTPVNWTAAARGGIGPHTYQFWVWNGRVWSIGRDWSLTPTWAWIPPAAGTYAFQVWVRNAGSAASYDAFRSAGPYTVGNPTGLTVTGLVPDRTFPVPQGTPVTWTASAVGGAGPYTYKFYVYDGTAWSVGQDWSESATWTWIPAASSAHVFQVWVRNARSLASYDAFRSAGPAIIGRASPLAVTSLALAPGAPPVADAPAVVTATATGGSGPYSYQFWLFDGATWSVGQDWSASRTFAWTPAAPGTYSMQVWVRNAASARSWDAHGSLWVIGVGP